MAANWFFFLDWNLYCCICVWSKLLCFLSLHWNITTICIWTYLNCLSFNAFFSLLNFYCCELHLHFADIALKHYHIYCIWNWLNTSKLCCNFQNFAATCIRVKLLWNRLQTLPHQICLILLKLLLQFLFFWFKLLLLPFAFKFS